MAELYDIALDFGYRYERPAPWGRHILRLLPPTVAGQQDLVSGLVRIEPEPDDRRDGRDFFGNATAQIDFDRPNREVLFRLTARVRRTALAPRLDLSPPLARLAGDLVAVRSLEPASPHHYIGPSERVKPDAAMTAYGRQATAGSASVLAAVQALGQRIHADMTFDRRATDVDTDAAAAFAARRGVCQDFTHIMIASLRGIGIPAGYVSGFLRTIPPPGKMRLAGADAMHAWVQAWCGAEMGWVQFDPTNDRIVGGDHIVVALGRDYADVAPIRGQLRAAGTQKTSQKVDVVPL